MIEPIKMWMDTHLWNTRYQGSQKQTLKDYQGGLTTNLVSLPRWRESVKKYKKEKKGKLCYNN